MRRHYWDIDPHTHSHIGASIDPVRFLYSDLAEDRDVALQGIFHAIDRETNLDPDLWKEIIKANERFPSNQRWPFISTVVDTGLPEGRDLMLSEMRQTDETRRWAAFSVADNMLEACDIPNGGWEAQFRKRARMRGIEVSKNDVALGLVESLAPLVAVGLNDQSARVRELAAKIQATSARYRQAVEAGAQIDTLRASQAAQGSQGSQPK